MKTLILHTKLLVSPKASSPSVTRVIEVTPNINLYRLAAAIVAAYGFDFDHCFGFYSNIDSYFYHDSKEQYELFADLDDVEPTDALSVKHTKVQQVWCENGKKMTFLFDYGDGWRFLVELMGSAEKRPNIRYPLVIKQKGRAPKQY
jgi:hypothetical protein